MDSWFKIIVRKETALKLKQFLLIYKSLKESRGESEWKFKGNLPYF
jgi:hypothetical protein